MSMTGSLMPFDNNNDSVKGKSKGGSKGKAAATIVCSNNGNNTNSVGGLGATVMTTTTTTLAGGSSSTSSLGGGNGCANNGHNNNNSNNRKQQQQQQQHKKRKKKKKKKCLRAHVNSLWSLWYGVCATAFQAYLLAVSAERYVNAGASLSPLERNAYLALSGSSLLVLPLFVTAAILKMGNLANDGYKLGRHLSAAAADAGGAGAAAGGGAAGPGVLAGVATGVGVVRSLWQHGGPTAPFLHLTAAFCLLLPKLVMEASLIHSGHLPQDDIWRTDLDFMVVHSDRLVILSFMANGTMALPAPLPSSAVAAEGATPDPSPAAAATTTAAPPTAAPAATTTNATNSTSGGGNITTTPLALPQSDAPRGLELRSADWGPVSAEFLNYALALLVYAVRYPAVFWHTNKAFGALFSLQLLVNGLLSLVSFAGLCVLYKVQVVGAKDALPMLQLTQRVNESLEGGSPFLLNTHVTLALFVLSNILVLASSLVLYLYGYGRLTAFLEQERERRAIVLRRGAGAGAGRPGWGYFTHCAALCVLLAVAVCDAPLLYDQAVVYRCSLDGAVLASLVAAIVHLLLWVLLWLALTLKQRWLFRLGAGAARGASLHRHRHDAGAAPLLVLGNGRTYTIADASPKKAIMSVIQKAALDRKARAALQGGGGGPDALDAGDEQVYWLRPKAPSPKASPDPSCERVTWLSRRGSSGTKHKVTFEDSLGSSSSRKGKSLLSKSPRSGGKGKKKGQPRGLHQLSESEDDGDYATLREPADANTTLLACSLAEGAGEEDEEEGSPSMDEADTATHTLLQPPPPQAPPTAVPDLHQGSVTPRCLRRADSGMPHDELTPRSDSVSTESSASGSASASGGSPACGNHSETSSGIHSNSSSDHNHHNHQRQQQQQQLQEGGARRSTSVDDLATSLEQPRIQPSWRSFSLQRNVAPPLPPPLPPAATTSSGQTIYSFGNVASGNHHYSSHQVATPCCTTTSTSTTTSCSSSSNSTTPASGAVPAVLLENTTVESTVVIRRKQCRPKTSDGNGRLLVKEEPFGRSTNMRMTSFTDDGSRCSASSGPHEALLTSTSTSTSSTLPHYPTQPAASMAAAAVYPHCSTMPLPSTCGGGMAGLAANPSSASASSCHAFPRHQHQHHHQHTTIPTHHNGVRLVGAPNPFAKRFPPYHHQQQQQQQQVALVNGRPPQVVVVAPTAPYGTMPGASAPAGAFVAAHHTFPHVKYTTSLHHQQQQQQQQPQQQNHHNHHNHHHHLHKHERDSANFSMASSGDSDQYLPPHT